MEFITFVAPDIYEKSQAQKVVNPDEIKFQKVYESMSDSFKSHFKKGKVPEFLEELKSVLANDTNELLLLCDKNHFLPEGYEPADLVLLEKTDAYNVNRGNLYLRSCAEKALFEMGNAARRAGLTLLVSSTYRSYEYQVSVYNRLVAKDGQEEADRESAKPGTSQHQTGAVVDFGSIDASYENTKPGKWLLENASRFGWSLSFPDGFEDVTGYKYECWHFRYLGKEACEFQDKWFGNIQQFMLEFIDAWRAYALEDSAGK